MIYSICNSACKKTCNSAYGGASFPISPRHSSSNRSKAKPRHYGVGNAHIPFEVPDRVSAWIYPVHVCRSASFDVNIVRTSHAKELLALTRVYVVRQDDILSVVCPCSVNIPSRSVR